MKTCFVFAVFALLSIMPFIAHAASREADMWLTDPLLQAYAQHGLPHGGIAEDGAAGKNANTPEAMQLAAQARGLDSIQYGIAAQKHFAVQDGVNAFKWAFDRQAADGAFGTANFTEVLNFLGAYGQAVTLLNDAGQDASALEAYAPKVKLAVANGKYRQGQAIWESRMKNNLSSSQIFSAALALHFANLADRTLQSDDMAAKWLDEGLRLRKGDGVLPEKGGRNASAQENSLKYLCLYALYGDNGTKAAILPALRDGFAWLAAQIQPDLTLATAAAPVKSSGKQVAPKRAVPLAFVLWSHLGGGEAARQTAQKLAGIP
ncbi:MAG: hypothetical protein PW788_11330 [Micavibrio sp.]|nr:hypothetical protein [Micavibrio sp.]